MILASRASKDSTHLKLFVLKNNAIARFIFAAQSWHRQSPNNTPSQMFHVKHKKQAQKPE